MNRFQFKDNLKWNKIDYSSFTALKMYSIIDVCDAS